jgi:hypothetical protein
VPPIAALGLSLLAAVGCTDGQDDPERLGEADAKVAASAGRYLPLKVGAQWTYRVQTSTGMEMKVTRVEALEPVPGKPDIMAFRIVTTKGSRLADKTVSWQEDTGRSIVRHVEDAYKPGGAAPTGRELWQPFKMRLDERPEKLKDGASWSVEYMETNRPANGVATTQKRSETWTVRSVDETVTVGDRTYRNCLRVNRVGTEMGAASNKDYWFARGIGKVKETGGQTEELVEVTGL